MSMKAESSVASCGPLTVTSIEQDLGPAIGKTDLCQTADLLLELVSSMFQRSRLLNWIDDLQILVED